MDRTGLQFCHLSSQGAGPDLHNEVPWIAAAQSRFISEPGGPGEPQLSKGQPLKYSERLKTLKSFTKNHRPHQLC